MSRNYSETTYNFSGIEGLENTVSEISNTFEARKEQESKVLCMVDDGDTWLQDYDRRPIVVYEDDDPVTASAVSQYDKYYTPTQFHTPFEALANSLSMFDDDYGIKGEIAIGKYRKRLTSNIQFDDVSLKDPTHNDVHLGLRINTAHNGFSAVNIEIGAERLICSNGMVAWDEKFSFKHEHNQGPFRDDLMYHVVDSVVNGVDEVQERFEKAHEQKLNSKDEMYMLLLDCGIEWLFEKPMSALQQSFDKEMSWHNNPQQMRESPSLYDAYTVGTYAIDHLANDGSSNQALDNARTKLKRLLETYDGDVPNSQEMVTQTVEERTDQLTSGADEKYDGERELVQQVAQAI